MTSAPRPIPPLATTLIGSYPQPDWLVDRSVLSKGVPRVRLRIMWRVPEPFLELCLVSLDQFFGHSLDAWRDCCGA